MSEVEVVFIILSRCLDVAIGTVKDLILNERYLAGQEGILKINDIYFDTPEGILGREKIGLRIRTLNETQSKLTLKIPKVSNQDYSERLEIERPWSLAALNEVVSALNSHININININKSGIGNNDTNYFGVDPKSALSSLGFNIIQKRETLRNIIIAVNKNSGQTEFEFAIDTTTYIINKHRIWNTELEIELKTIDSNDKVQLTNFIEKLKVHRELFQLWPHSKLVTGKAIESLLVGNHLKEHLDFDNNSILAHSGIEKLESYIKSMSF
jgi:hypothetical protein